MDLVSIVCRRRHYSPRTEGSYKYCIREFIYSHDKRHSGTQTALEVEAFLNHLVLERRVSAST
ncbi:MAG: phage integrase N-terminal SAM-like domain-containing protein [Acidithiobacillus ferriphilus]